MKKVVIAGSRTCDDYDFVKSKLNQIKWKEDDVIISGCADGADSLGERYAKEHNIKLERCPADWDQYGKKAGYIRNKKMAEVCTHAVVFWDGKSKGSALMIDLLSKFRRRYVVFYI